VAATMVLLRCSEGGLVYGSRFVLTKPNQMHPQEKWNDDDVKELMEDRICETLGFGLRVCWSGLRSI
jgi:hypothetical protein